MSLSCFLPNTFNSAFISYIFVWQLQKKFLVNPQKKYSKKN